MKNFFLHLILCINLLSLNLYTQNYNPKNTVIAVDMDDVFVQSHKFNLGLYFLNLIFLKNPSFLWKMATDSTFRKEIMHMYSKKGINNGGSTYNLAMTAQLYPAFQSYFDDILTKFHSSRSLIDDVVTLLRDIKSAGYTIIVATNRDRMGFEIIMNQLNFNTLYYDAPLFDAILTAQRAPFVQATTLPDGKRFSTLNPKAQWDTYITCVTAFKPEKAYYKGLRELVDTYATSHTGSFDTQEPSILFFDDQIKNVTGAALSGYGIKAFVVPQADKADQMRLDLASQGVVIPYTSTFSDRLHEPQRGVVIQDIM